MAVNNNQLRDEAAERAVIAALLTSPNSYDDVAEKLTSGDFVTPAHAAVFDAVIAVEAAGKPIDVITVTDELRRRRALKRAGGADNVADLAQAGGELAHLSAHIAIIEEKSLLRRTIAAGQQMCAAALAPDTTADKVVDEAETAVFALQRNRNETSLTPMAQAIPDLLAELAKGRSGQMLGHSTGIEGLDRVTGGLQPGQLILLAARPGVGKSALALQMARHIAETTGLSVPFLSYEMATNELTLRLLGGALRCDITRLRAGDIPPEMERDIAVAAERLAGVPLLIDDNPPATIAGVRSAMRSLARRADLGAVFIDYLQLVDGDESVRGANRNDVVSSITRGAKRLAVELGVPVIGLSQLNRAVTERGGKPRLSDLRESGSLEQDANVVGFVIRDLESVNADPTRAELLIAKQRSGPAGVSIPLTFHPQSTTFTDGAHTGVTGAPTTSPF